MTDRSDYTVSEAAKALGRSPETIRNWIRNGYLIAYRPAPKTHYRIPLVEIERIKGERFSPETEKAL